MINKIIYLIIFSIFISPLKAVEIYNKNNNELHITTGMSMIKDRISVSNRKFECPIVNFNIKSLGNIYKSNYISLNTNFNFNLNEILDKNYKFIKFRLYSIGLTNKKFGNINFGKSYGVIYNVDKFTQVIPMIKSISKPVNYMLYKADKVLTYTNNDFFNLIDGLDISIQKQFRNEEKSNSPLKFSTRYSNGEGYGLSVNYKLNKNIDLAGAYFLSKRTMNQITLDRNNNNTNAEAFSLGFKLDTKRFYISSIYGQTYNITPYGNFLLSISEKDKTIKVSDPIAYGFFKKTKNIEFVAQYKFLNVIPSIGYFQSKSYRNRNNYSRDIMKYIELGFNCKFDKYLSTIINYKINLVKYDLFCKRTNLFCENSLDLGFNYSF